MNISGISGNREIFREDFQGGQGCNGNRPSDEVIIEDLLMRCTKRQS